MCGADLYRSRPDQQVFESIFAAENSAHADDGQLGRARHLIDCTQVERLDRRSRETAGDVGKHRPSSPQVDGHAEIRVGNRERIRAGILGDARHLDDVADVR